MCKIMVKIMVAGYPKTHKIDKSYKELDTYKIEIIFYDEEEIQANIISPKGEKHFVTCSWGYWRCTCWDWTARWEKVEGAYNCKHIEMIHHEITYRLIKNLPILGIRKVEV